LGEAEYLTEFDCRENPMWSSAFEAGLQKIHSFDFLNGRPMTRAGAKYYDRISKIQEDLVENRELYGEDDEKDREIKMSGFYDEELEFRMTGLKVNRPSSPGRKKVAQSLFRNSTKRQPSTRTSTGSTKSSWTMTEGSRSSATTISKSAESTTSTAASTSSPNCPLRQSSLSGPLPRRRKRGSGNSANTSSSARTKSGRKTSGTSTSGRNSSSAKRASTSGKSSRSQEARTARRAEE
jgi:hypothetical protein